MKAFVIPSDSMCPAICEHERIYSSMVAYRNAAPARGDIIMFVSKVAPQLYIKRVIAVGGDVVSEASGKILVNGQPAKIPTPSEICGSPPPAVRLPGARLHFQQTTVPQGTYFVIGDNLNGSMDSRIPSFGTVKNEDIRGKPLFLYWSPSGSRIGCRIR